jgi:hypothetical protein
VTKGFGNILQQAQKLKAKMEALQEELGQRTVEASAGGGMVTVVVNGKQEVVSIKIEPEIVKPEEAEMVQDLVLAAVNEGLRRSKEMVAEEMSKLTGGLGLPGLM